MTKRDCALGGKPELQSIVVEDNVVIRRSASAPSCYEVCSPTSETDYIDFSILSGHFIKSKGNDIFCCSISVGQNCYQICDMSEDEFWSLVEGKQFHLYSDNTTYLIDPVSMLSKGITSVREMASSIISALNKGQYSEVEGLTRSCPCLHFIEQ